jgi:YVTN family beta-propeller protein
LAEVGYAILRIGVAVLFLFHAPQKLYGWYGGPQYPAISMRGLAAVLEIVASPLLVLGLFTRWAALAAAADMVAAYLVVHLPRGGWPIENRGEVALLYFLIFVYIGVRGGGAFSVDRILREQSMAPARVIWSATAALAVLGILGVGAYASDSASIRRAWAPNRTDATARGVRLFVTNEGSGNLSVIDAATQTVVATAPLGKRPRGIRLSPDRKSLYVALSGSPNAAPGVDRNSLPPPDRGADGIGEVDVATLKVKRIIHAGIDPEQLDVSPDGTRLYVANEDAAQLTVVDLPSGRIVTTVKVGKEPEGVAIRPDGKVVYVASEADGQVFAIDTATNRLLARIAVGRRPRSIAFLPDGSRAYVTLESDGAITVIDAFRHRFLELIPLEEPGRTPKPRPMGIAVGPGGAAIYVTTGSFGKVFFFNPATNKTVASLAVGQRPWGVALMPDGRTAYTANGPSNDVSVVDLQTHEVLKRIRVSDRPWGIAVAGYAGAQWTPDR